MLDRHPDIQHDILTVWVLNDLAQTLPTVQIGITLKKVVPIDSQSLHDSKVPWKSFRYCRLLTEHKCQSTHRQP
jgi:hypothetical protein